MKHQTKESAEVYTKSMKRYYHSLEQRKRHGGPITFRSADERDVCDILISASQTASKTEKQTPPVKKIA